MVEYSTDFAQEFGADTASSKNAIDIAPVTLQLLRKPTDGAWFGLFVKDFFDGISDVHS
jgi:hypothetical protein